jgi:hypothetical protein
MHHRPVGEHLRGRHREAVLGLGIEGAVAMVLGGTGGEVLAGRAVFPHVIGRLNGIGVHRQGAVGTGRERHPRPRRRLTVFREQLVAIEGRGAAVEMPEDAASGRGIVQLLDADRQRDFRLAGQDVLPGAVQRHRRRGAAALDIDHRHPLGEQPFAHQRDETDLTAHHGLAPVIHHAVAEPGELDIAPVGHAGIGEYSEIGVAAQIAHRLVGKAPEGRGKGTDDIDVAGHDDAPHT